MIRLSIANTCGDTSPLVVHLWHDKRTNSSGTTGSQVIPQRTARLAANPINTTDLAISNEQPPSDVSKLFRGCLKPYALPLAACRSLRQRSR